VKALVPLNNAKKCTQNVRVFIMQPGRLVEYTRQCGLLHIYAYVSVDQARTRFLSLGNASVRQFLQLPASIATTRAVVQTTTDGKVRMRGNAILRSTTSKSYLICVSIEAMVVNRVNIMNRSYQSRTVNLSSYLTLLHKTTTRLQAIKNDNQVMQWLQYRLQENPSLRESYPEFTVADFELGWKHTTIFVDLFVSRLEQRIPQLDIVCRFDVFEPITYPRAFPCLHRQVLSMLTPLRLLLLP
jgi:hypothetical protein